MFYKHLFEPLDLIGGVRLPNRILMGSMHTGLEARPDGIERLAAFYAERARGGAALIVTGGFSPNDEGELGPHRAQFSTPADRDRHRPIPDAVHAAGSRIVLQLLHSGRYGYHQRIVAPSAIKAPINPATPREMSAADISRTIDDFAGASRLAAEAGYDGVEIMGSEGYLVTQFLALRTNHRSDDWGGALENRIRFACAVVRAVRGATAPDFIVVYRISALDLVEGGLSGDETIVVAKAIQDAGATILNTGIGWHEARVPTIAQAVPRGGFAWAARRIKQAVGIPVVASNRINEPGIAEDILARGDADMVSLARALLADAEFANKAKAGDRAAINVCIACNQACLDHYFAGQPASCVVNPRAGRETKLVYVQAVRRKRVAVVGGGPAGLSCAAVAAERSHEVTLFERSAQLGGQFNLAQRIPGKQEFAESIAYYAERLRRAGAKIVFNHAPGARELASFDEVVLATGVEPRRPSIPGIDDARVVRYADAIAGRTPIGEAVAILGAGGIGFDVALFLLERSSRSTLDAQAFARHWGVSTDHAAGGGLDAGDRSAARAAHRITMLKRSHTPFGHTLGRSTGWVHRAELARSGVKMLKGVEYRRIDTYGLHIALEGVDAVVPFDTIVVCVGQEPQRSLAPALEALGRAPYLIGGAREAGELDAKRAMLEGAELAARL